MASKAYGYLYDYGYMAGHESILLNAVTNVSGPDLVAGLTEIQGDTRALLGASRLYFQNQFPARLPKDQACMLTAKLSEVVLTSGREDESISVFRILSNDASPEILDLLRKVARQGTGRTYTLRGMLYSEPLPVASAYLCLAMHADAEVKPEIENLLSTTTRPADRTALELALALLTETNHVRTDCFCLNSALLARAALKAVQRFPNQENLDALVLGSFSYPDQSAWLMEETAAAFEKIASNHRPVTARYNGEIKGWWAANRTKFAKAGAQAVPP
jgi:hypothetical protein